MAKIKSQFTCQNCAYTSPKWLGKCPECSSWNSLVEESLSPKTQKDNFYTLASEPQSLSEIAEEKYPRMHTQIDEFDRLMGGGIVKGSVTLLGGDPGIGKSTLVLQILDHLAKQGYESFYLTGEESLSQIKLRAERLKINSDKITLMAENNLEQFLIKSKERKIDFLIIDSIQTVYLPELGSTPGSVSQIRECAGKIIYYTKTLGCASLLVGQVTKDGALAGPKVLEHLVDTVLYFEGDRGQSYRILRTFKNRYGATSEIGVFEMKEEGLCEVNNPSELFLSQNKTQSPGSVIISSLEGTRPILAELQALVVESFLASPRRVCLGVDNARVALLAAVLEKIGGIQISKYDLFLNVVGGIKVDEPAVDLGIFMALASSFLDKKFPEPCLCLGEIGLNGELRSVNGILPRIKEALKLGINEILLPDSALKDLKKTRLDQNSQLKIHPISKVSHALEFLT